jgi:gliding motility-associated-like protein
LPAPVIDSMALQYVLQKGTIVLKPTVTGTNLQYLWTPNLYLNNNTLKNPTFTGVGDIIYTLTVNDAAGCTTSAQLPIKVLKPIIIPNTFTPNGDGVNDTWVIDELHNYPGATVRIFDRYGMQLLYSEGYGKPWDGTYKGKPVPYGVYYYLIDIKPYGAPLSGFITVIR